MPSFEKMVEAPHNSKFILSGNNAFALGVVHAGYHAADGYPGTPSTEVIDRCLSFVQNRIQVGWSVNEAVAVSVCLGRAIAGFDTVVTMKMPGVFQAGDPITTNAFFSGKAGALVIYAATDYVPSSTQHVIDTRYFFASSRLPILEPRNHQEMYEIAWHAADMSREFNTPVVILASGILAHSEGLVTTKQPRTITPLEVPENIHDWMLLPSIARKNYNLATQKRIPSIQKWSETSDLVNEIDGSDEWGIIVSGESTIVVQEALSIASLNLAILSLAIAYPLPKERILTFAKKIKGKLFIIEDGDTYIQDQVRLLGIKVTGKDEYSIITSWTPESVLEFLSKHIPVSYQKNKIDISLKPVPRPPTICPGCVYRAFALTIAKLKKRNKIFASFGDIGCSTLLYFINNAIDTVSCMGSSDSIRQGFVMSRPEMAHRTISVIGDSCECHSGMDSTRNAVFRNIPGVKVILDNRITAMTGGQVAPSSEKNLEGQNHAFNLRKAIESEVNRTVTLDAYNISDIQDELKRSLELAEKGEFSVLIIEGSCIKEIPGDKRVRTIIFDYDKCTQCGLCDMCPGIEIDEKNYPYFTSLCTNCGSQAQICMQRCPCDAIIPSEKKLNKNSGIERVTQTTTIAPISVSKDSLPETLRLAIRGIGGQGNLFFGKVLSEVALRTPYSEMHIVKGDTHGMAQLGGSVISTFSCGNVFSPTPAPHSTDVLVVMEVNEVLREGFLDLLKPDGIIILNEFTSIPVNAKKEDYPLVSDIETMLDDYNVIKINANKIAADLGDISGKTANVVILGLLSTVKPFNSIPAEIWLSAIQFVSPNSAIQEANFNAFQKGKEGPDTTIKMP